MKADGKRSWGDAQSKADKVLGRVREGDATDRWAGRFRLDGDMPVSALTPEHVADLKAARADEGNATGTVAAELRILRAACKMAEENGYAPPAVRKWKVPPTARKLRYLTVDEALRVLRRLHPDTPIKAGSRGKLVVPQGLLREKRQDVHDLFLALVMTGGRWAEVGTLTWRQLEGARPGRRGCDPARPGWRAPLRPRPGPGRGAAGEARAHRREDLAGGRSPAWRPRSPQDRRERPGLRQGARHRGGRAGRPTRLGGVAEGARRRWRHSIAQVGVVRRRCRSAGPGPALPVQPAVPTASWGVHPGRWCGILKAMVRHPPTPLKERMRRLMRPPASRGPLPTVKAGRWGLHALPAPMKPGWRIRY